MLHLMDNRYKNIKMGVTSQGNLRKYYKKQQYFNKDRLCC